MTLTGLSGLPVNRPQGLTDMAFQLIRDAIVNKVVAPGSRVTESALAKQIGVSKTPVREALLRLRHIGLLEPDTGGLRVVLPSRERIQQAYQYREGVEAMAARYASANTATIDSDALMPTAEASLSCAEAGDRAGFRTQDREFHGIIAERTANPFLERVAKEAVMLTAVLRQRDVAEGGDSIDCARHHVEIADAILAHDSDRAEQHMIEHIRKVASLVLRQGPPADSSTID